MRATQEGVVNNVARQLIVVGDIVALEIERSLVAAHIDLCLKKHYGKALVLGRTGVGPELLQPFPAKATWDVQDFENRTRFPQ